MQANHPVILPYEMPVGNDQLTLQEIARSLRSLPETALTLRRLTEVLAPTPQEKVGSKYVARLLGCPTTYVAQMTREGRIPPRCAVPGTGSGKPWRFFREPIAKGFGSR